MEKTPKEVLKAYVDSQKFSSTTQIMDQMRVYAKKAGLKPSFCYYKRWGVKKKGGQGHKPVIPLRFSKSGDPEIERWYATHFVDTKRVSQLKAAALERVEPPRQEGESPEDGASIS